MTPSPRRSAERNRDDPAHQHRPGRPRPEPRGDLQRGRPTPGRQGRRGRSGRPRRRAARRCHGARGAVGDGPPGRHRDPPLPLGARQPGHARVRAAGAEGRLRCPGRAGRPRLPHRRPRRRGGRAHDPAHRPGPRPGQAGLHRGPAGGGHTRRGGLPRPGRRPAGPCARRAPDGDDRDGCRSSCAVQHRVVVRAGHHDPREGGRRRFARGGHRVPHRHRPHVPTWGSRTASASRASR